MQQITSSSQKFQHQKNSSLWSDGVAFDAEVVHGQFGISMEQS
jgi:hypothetical protein